MLMYILLGIDSLFKKLNQGCVENEKLLALANARAEAEYAYGYKLKDIPTNLAVKKKTALVRMMVPVCVNLLKGSLRKWVKKEATMSL